MALFDRFQFVLIHGTSSLTPEYTGSALSSTAPIDGSAGYPDLVLTNHQSVVILVNDGLWPADPGGMSDISRRFRAK
jgi:hypothetical protein